MLTAKELDYNKFHHNKVGLSIPELMRFSNELSSFKKSRKPKIKKTVDEFAIDVLDNYTRHLKAKEREKNSYIARRSTTEKIDLTPAIQKRETPKEMEQRVIRMKDDIKTMKIIVRCACEAAGITHDYIKEKKKDEARVVPRHIAVFLTRYFTTKLSLKYIGLYIGNKADHSVIIHSSVVAYHAITKKTSKYFSEVWTKTTDNLSQRGLYFDINADIDFLNNLKERYP